MMKFQQRLGDDLPLCHDDMARILLSVMIVTRTSTRHSMAEIVIVWILGLIVIAIAWGVTDRIAVSIKALVNALAQSVQMPERSRRVQVVVAGLLAFAVISIIVVAADNHTGKGGSGGLPALLIWAGGLWLIPFRFAAVEHYWISLLAIVVILAPFWVRRTSSPSTVAHTRIDISTQGQDTSASVTGLGFLFWIFWIGLTVAAIARYTSMWNAAVLNS